MIFQLKILFICNVLQNYLKYEDRVGYTFSYLFC